MLRDRSLDSLGEQAMRVSRLQARLYLLADEADLYISF